MYKDCIEPYAYDTKITAFLQFSALWVQQTTKSGVHTSIIITLILNKCMQWTPTNTKVLHLPNWAVFIQNQVMKTWNTFEQVNTSMQMKNSDWLSTWPCSWQSADAIVILLALLCWSDSYSVTLIQTSCLSGKINHGKLEKDGEAKHMYSLHLAGLIPHKC